MPKLTNYINEKQKKHIIFDFDETLFQLHLDWSKYFDNAEKQLTQIDPQLFSDYKQFRISFTDMQNKFVMYHGEKAREIIWRNSEVSEEKLLLSVTPNRELIEEVKQLHDAALYIWSSNSRKVIEKILTEYELDNSFAKLVTRTEVSLIKPYPEGFSHIHQPHHKKKDYVFVGDSKSDKGAADALGIDFFKIDFFHTGYPY